MFVVETKNFNIMSVKKNNKKHMAHTFRPANLSFNSLMYSWTWGNSSSAWTDLNLSGLETVSNEENYKRN